MAEIQVVCTTLSLSLCSKAGKANDRKAVDPTFTLSEAYIMYIYILKNVTVIETSVNVVDLLPFMARFGGNTLA